MANTSFHRRLKNRQRIIENFEVKANANRTPAEKFADALTAKLGSVGFLIVNAVWIITWVLINSGFFPSIPVFDPFPFGLLTMIVSLEAIALAIVVLISQNRGAKIDDLRDEVSLQINTITEEEITKMLELQIKLLKKAGIDVSDDRELRQMLEPPTTEELERTLEKQAEHA